ncbi:hypothetical protein LWI29_010488 [Acer saccharum]|uniref:Uncharacterized protein n=1 Tax=Acer saccharum TaxID=4024 RepID=A0AA39VHF8_ACESA|nr:hypothetical protein LWI29_010488 [Acer saccharum]
MTTTTHHKMQNPSQKNLKMKPKTTTMLNNYQTHVLLPNQCGSTLVQTIDAPLPLVWSILRRFDHPQGYKRFIKSCTLRTGTGGTGSVREVVIVTGLPARTSMERLDKLDDELHVMMVSIIGGDHRLENYHSTTSLHGTEGGRETVVIESYVVDVPAGNSKEETCAFVDTIIGCNLKSLASVTEKMAAHVYC